MIAVRRRCAVVSLTTTDLPGRSDHNAPTPIAEATLIGRQLDVTNPIQTHFRELHELCKFARPFHLGCCIVARGQILGTASFSQDSRAPVSWSLDRDDRAAA